MSNKMPMDSGLNKTLTQRSSEVLEEFEKRVIIDSLIGTKGNVTMAARELKITYHGLYYRMMKYDIRADIYETL